MKETKFIKENGIFYTSENLANIMISQLDIDYSTDFNIIEPAVGEGHILYYIVLNFLENNRNKETKFLISFLENNVAGFDIRKEAVNKCISKLNYLTSQYFEETVNWNIKQLDALLQKKRILREFARYSYVISNPPFVSRRNMTKKNVEFLKENSHFCMKYNYDLYYYFFEIGLELWNGKGKIVYITPNSYIRARGARTMVKYLVDNNLIETIIDFDDELLFENAMTYSAITALSKGNKVLNLKDKFRNIIEQKEYSMIVKENYEIYSHPFLFKKVSEHKKLSEIAEIRNGLATLNDKVFIINSQDIVRQYKNKVIILKNGVEYELERSSLKKVTRISDFSNDRFLIFPYKKSNQTYMRMDNIDKKLPLTYKYLSETLNSEYQKKYGVYFGRTQGFSGYDEQKIVISKIASLNGSAFKILENGFIMSGISIKLTDNRYDIEKLVEYLNSNEIVNYLEKVSKNYSSGYRSISTTDLKYIPIPSDRKR
ncbi:Eco57I restriction-modification methylase domain-containing protein [Streptococcus oricebi]|uniref:Eco57I restriction-modification methylase domain-containing protein n=1 Tax=Streptococcus oricebi TaxID=1547447 RepID=UPI001FDA9408|nr:Eco57I restriction-modification methylase domain-containing protein [Streptococcus oricebi]